MGLISTKQKRVVPCEDLLVYEKIKLTVIWIQWNVYLVSYKYCFVQKLSQVWRYCSECFIISDIFYLAWLLFVINCSSPHRAISSNPTFLWCIHSGVARLMRVLKENTACYSCEILFNFPPRQIEKFDIFASSAKQLRAAQSHEACLNELSISSEAHHRCQSSLIFHTKLHAMFQASRTKFRILSKLQIAINLCHWSEHVWKNVFKELIANVWRISGPRVIRKIIAFRLGLKYKVNVKMLQVVNI